MSNDAIDLMDLFLKYDADNEAQMENLSKVKLKDLKKDAPGAKLKYVTFEINKIDHLKQLKLPNELLSNLSRKLVRKYYDRTLSEPPSNILQYKPMIRYAILSLFCYFRTQVLTYS